VRPSGGSSQRGPVVAAVSEAQWWQQSARPSGGSSQRGSVVAAVSEAQWWQQSARRMVSPQRC
jgi:hypothetical protein